MAAPNLVHTIGICTGGGDCPGLNAVIRAAVKCAILKHDWKVMGIEDGFDGLIFRDKCLQLGLADVSGILPRGGTILGTTNRGNPFKYKMVENGQEVVKDLSTDVICNAKRMGLDALIVVGGDGTQGIGLQLFRLGLPVVGVPKTIDNDLSATEVTFGFDTAIHTVTEAIDKLHTTAESHHRIMVVEVMGRDAGWIALHSGLAGGAHVILVPEIPFTIENIAGFVDEREAGGKQFTVVVVAEGIKMPGDLGHWSAQDRRATAVTPRPGTVGNVIGEALGMATHKEVRVTVLGHIQRGGSPSPFDRILSTRFGVAAVELIARGEFGKMVALRGGHIVTVDITEAVGQMKTVDPQGELVMMGRSIGVCFGD